MTKLHFEVASSSNNGIYKLKAILKDGRVRFTCTCPAGQNGSFCKHRISLIKGDIGNFVKVNDQDIAEIQRLFEGSKTLHLLQDIEKLEHIETLLKIELSKAKKALSLSFFGE